MDSYRKLKDDKLDGSTPVSGTARSLFQLGTYLLPKSSDKGAVPVGIGEFCSPIPLLQNGVNYVKTENFFKEVQEFCVNLRPVEIQKRESELKKFRDWLNKNVPIRDHQGNEIYVYNKDGRKLGKIAWEVLGNVNLDGYSILGLKYYQAPIYELLYGTQTATFTRSVGEKVLMPALEKMLNLGFKMCAVNEHGRDKFIFITNEEFMHQLHAEHKHDDVKAFASYQDFSDKMQPIPSRSKSCFGI